MANISVASLVAQMVKNLPAMQETQVRSLDQEDPLEKGMATHSSVFTWRIQWRNDLVGYSPWSHKESNTTEWLSLSLFILGLTGLIILQSKGLSGVSFSTRIWKHQFFGAQPSLWFNSHIHTWLLGKPQLWLYGPLLAK